MTKWIILLSWPLVGFVFSFIITWFLGQIDKKCPSPTSVSLSLRDLVWGVFLGWLTAIWFVILVLIHLLENVKWDRVIYTPDQAYSKKNNKLNDEDY